MRNPRIEVKLDKIRHNTREIVGRCRKSDIDIAGVTKVFCADTGIAGAMVDGGVKYLADSRMRNLLNLSSIDIPRILLRIPMQSEVEEVVRYTDYSLNSEIDTMEKLSKEGIKQKKKHKVILMIDLGDLREGVWYEHAEEVANAVVRMEGLELAGLGTNLTCYGGVIPSCRNLSLLSGIADRIMEKYNLKLTVISGGNSSSLHLLNRNEMPRGINNLRIGEAIVLGRETAFGQKLEGLHDDAFILYAEIIEIKKKPSVPIGDIGMDAFGNVPRFKDMGERTRAIAAIGRQDIDPEGLIPQDDNIKILGASSDHLILDMTETRNGYNVGSHVPFKMSYGCLLRAMTSPYVVKLIK